MSADLALRLKEYLKNHPEEISHVVNFNKGSDRLHPFDFTSANTDLKPEIIANTNLFSEWIDQQIKQNNCLYGIGGYNEHRTLYARSNLFDTAEEPRRLHLGVDIWGKAGTPVYCPINAKVHSFKFNNHFGDYGATIILEHDLDDLKLYSLYGHLNLSSLDGLKKQQYIPKGKPLAEFGIAEENGHWPPHLHFQLLFNMQGFEGDYPGVCRFSEQEKYLLNCPDPQVILKSNFQEIV
ncbi:MAG: peptidoglycan DD-metalloendopeptidase family protein [Daejeonella sp.]